VALDEATKNTHLSWGRVWIDSEYLCAYDETDATENIKHANSLAGYANMNGTLYTDAPAIESSAVTAGSVSSSETYSSGYKASDPSLDQAAALLNYDCTELSGGASLSLTRT